MALMSVHFYSGTFEHFRDYGHTRAELLSSIQSKPYLGGSTLTGHGINRTVAAINAGNYPNGVPKIMVVLTDGISYDNVFYAS